MSITGSNNPFACEPVVFANTNAIVSLGTITRDGNEFTFSVGFVWKINGVTYQNTTPIVLTITDASVGFNRIDNALLNTSNTIELQQGNESDTIALKPIAPDTNIILTSWNISGTTIGDTEDPILGTSFVKKSYTNPTNYNGTGADVIIPLDPNGYSEIRLTNASLTSIAGFDLSLITGVSTAEVPYNGKPYIIRNLTGNDITIKNELGAADYPFYLVDGADLTFPNNQAIYVTYDASGFIEIFKSWIEVDLSTKLDKDATAGVERAYIVNADGSQSTKATIEFKDVLDFANLASFPVTGETGKIYLALDTNKTYRWSGSAYVQLSGGIDFPVDGKTYGVKDGLAVRVEEHDFFNPYTSDYFVGTIRPQGQGLTSFLLTGVLNSWVATGTLETFSESSEFILVGLKSTTTTAGSSLQFSATSGRSRFYINPAKNKSIHRFIFRNSDASPVANARFFVGLFAGNVVPIGNVNPSTLINCIGFGADSGDTNIHLIHNDYTGVATKVDLGVNFPANTQNVDTYVAYFFIDKHNNKLYARLERLNTGNDTGVLEVTTDIFAINNNLDPYIWRNNGTTDLEVKMRIGGYLSANKIM